MKKYNLDVLKNGFKLTLLTTTLIATLNGCHKKEFNSYSTTNGNVNVTNITIINENEYNAVKHETNNYTNSNDTIINNYSTPTPTPTPTPKPTAVPTKKPTPTVAPKDNTNDKSILNYFKSKLNDIQSSADKEDIDAVKEKGNSLVDTYDKFIKGDIDICGIKFSELSKATKEQIESDKKQIKELVDSLYENNKDTIDDVKEAIDETIEQDKKNIEFILDLFRKNK